jgi:hypothetical protein
MISRLKEESASEAPPEVTPDEPEGE